MKKIAILLFTFVLSACGMLKAPFQPPIASIYTDYKAPLQTEYNDTDLGSKVGESSAYSILSVVSVGDASVNTAARHGRIKTIKHVDYGYRNVLLGLFSKTTIYVYGD